MPWQCRLVDSEEAMKRIGDMWFGEVWPITNKLGRFFCPAGELSDEYVRDHMATRRPIIVMMPKTERFSPDCCYTGRTNGWTVTGDAPSITVSPSVNLVGRYHGWIQGGVISNDVEGRAFT